MRPSADLDTFLDGLKKEIALAGRRAARTSVCIERVAVELPVSMTLSMAAPRIGAPIRGAAQLARIHIVFVRRNGPEEDCT